MGSEYERMPRLTIMEEVLLLGLKDKQVSGSCDRSQGWEICCIMAALHVSWPHGISTNHPTYR